MSGQPANSSRLTNSAVNIIGATTANNTNYGVSRIGVTGNSFDISAFGSGNIVTLGATGTGNVTIGNGTSGTVTFPGVTTFTSAVNGGVFTGTSILGTTSSTALTIGSNLTSGSISLGVTGSNNTITIGNNGVGATGTVNVGSGSANINIGTNAASTVNIGNASGIVNINKVRLSGTPMVAYSFGILSQTIANGTDTIVLFPTADTRNGTGTGITYSPATGTFTNSNSYSVTITACASIGFASNSTGFRVAYIVHSNSSIGRIAMIDINATVGDPSVLSLSGTTVLNAGEYVYVSVYQTSGSGLNIGGAVLNLSRASLLVL